MNLRRFLYFMTPTQIKRFHICTYLHKCFSSAGSRSSSRQPGQVWPKPTTALPEGPRLVSAHEGRRPHEGSPFPENKNEKCREGKKPVIVVAWAKGKKQESTQ